MRRGWWWACTAIAGVVVAALGPAWGQALRIGTAAPDVSGGPWINSAPLTTDALRGRVVLVEFWTFG